ncbi:MAG TPA: protelomerase family protein [Ktedonobacteraceae bacterium]
MKQWLAERVQVLLPQLAVLGCGQEGEIERLCEEEIAAWRARPTMKALRSLNTPMIDTRNAIRTLPVTQENSWINPRTREREHLALRYLNFSDEEWAAMKALTEEGRQQRLEGQQLLDEPEAIVERAATLLVSPRWEDLAVGLAVTTGRRLTELLKTATFHPLSTYTVQFAGQLKQKAEKLAPYEIPTLVEAALVLDAWKRLRSWLDCAVMVNGEVERRHGPTVRATADRQFVDLVPTRSGREENLFVHLFRSVYGALAVYFFCPPAINALEYKATIAGHYWVERAGTEQMKRNYLSTLHYDDYKIGDGHGGLDARQGVWLGRPGVKVLEVFQHAVVEQQQKEERAQMAKQERLTVVKASKTGYSMYKPRQETKQRIDQIAQERDLRHHDEVLSLLADTYRVYEQMEGLLAPQAELYGTATPLETLAALLQADPSRPVAATLNEHLRERWGASLEEVEALFAQAAALGAGKPAAYLREQLEKQANYRQGPVKRQEHYNQTDFTTLSLEQLKALRVPEATTERIHRAVQAIMAYNQTASHDLDRWFIRAKEIKELVGGRGELIRAYLQDHQQEIAQHHQEFHLTEKFNTKPFAITDKIHLA